MCPPREEEGVLILESSVQLPAPKSQIMLHRCTGPQSYTDQDTSKAAIRRPFLLIIQMF